MWRPLYGKHSESGLCTHPQNMMHLLTTVNTKEYEGIHSHAGRNQSFGIHDNFLASTKLVGCAVVQMSQAPLPHVNYHPFPQSIRTIKA